MDSDEFDLWVQYDSECALPDFRQELFAGLQMMHAVNISGKSVKKPEPLSSFMPFQPKPEIEEQEVDPLEMFRNA